MNSFNTERIFCCSSIILIKNRYFIFLCVSISKCHNPLSLKVLLKYMKRCKRTKNHLPTISAHNITCSFHISILFPGQEKFGLFKTGVSPRESSSPRRILNWTFWMPSPCKSWRASCRSPTILAIIRERASSTSALILQRRSGQRFHRLCWMEPQHFPISWILADHVFELVLLVPLRLPQS